MAILFSTSGYNIAIVVLSIMISISGIVLGVGYAMDDRRVKSFAKGELYQSLLSGALLGALIIAFGSGGIVNSFIGSNVVNMGYHTCTAPLNYNGAICFAHDYLAGLYPISVGNASFPSITDSVLALLLPTMGLYAGLAGISSIGVNILGFSLNFSAMMTPILKQMSYVIEALTLSLISVQVQDALLRVVAGVATPLLLPLGLVLRIFYPTRRLGGAIIAIAIALFVILPLSYV